MSPQDFGHHFNCRTVEAVHGYSEATVDGEFELGLSQYLFDQYGRDGLQRLYKDFSGGEGALEFLMRRAIWRALASEFGHEVCISSSVVFKHLERLEIGDKVFFGAQSHLYGRYDGHGVIGNHVWVGPQCFLDARALCIEDFVGLGPGVKILGSAHTEIPCDLPIMQTDLEIKPVRIGEGADIGVNATILPGVTIGKRSIVGAGALVTKDVPGYAVVGGVPAQFLRWRRGYEGEEGHAG